MARQASAGTYGAGSGFVQRTSTKFMTLVGPALTQDFPGYNVRYCSVRARRKTRTP